MKKIIGISMSTKEGQNPKNYLDYDYVDAVIAAGGIPLLIPNIGAEYAEEYIKNIGGLILSGGADVTPFYYHENPHKVSGPFSLERDIMEIALYKEARKAGLPILGICRGMQIIAAIEGGGLIQDIPSQFESDMVHVLSKPPYITQHLAKGVDGTLIAELLGTGERVINSLHHQGVKSMPKDFVISMSARDGMIEAIENKEKTVLALQFHPERLHRDDDFLKLFSWLVEEAK